MGDKTRPGKLLFRVINNTAALMGGDFFYHLINFAASILVARSLGGEAYGKYSFIFVFLSFFEIIVQFGLNPILTRECAQKKNEIPQILGNAILIRLALMGMVLPVALVLIKVLGYPVSVQQGVFLASFQLFLTLRSIYETVFRVNLAMFYPALWNALRAVLNLALVAAIVAFHPTIFLFIGASVVSGFAGLAGLILFSRRFIQIDFRPRWNLIRYLVKESAPLIIASCLTLLYCKIDVFMLSMMKGFSDVGYYSVATRLTEPLDIIAGSVTVSLFPLLARSFKENRSKFEIFFSKAFLTLLLIGLPLALGGSFVAKDLVLLFFGREYSVAGMTLGILFWYNFFGFLSTLFVNLLMACGKQIMDAWLSLLLLFGNAVMNLFLIPQFSYNGAALATVLTEIVGTTIMLAYLVRERTIRLPFPRREVMTALKINIPFLIFLLGLKMIFALPLFVFILLGIFGYLALLLGLRIISLADLKNYALHWIDRAEEIRK